MSLSAEAIVTDGKGGFSLEHIELNDPGQGEVLIKIEASGVCHTDFDSMSWGKSLIMGHEGAGVVMACGPEVPGLKRDDRVLLNWAIPCGECFQCKRGAENICEQQPSVPDCRFKHDSLCINTSFSLGTMSTHTIVPWQACVKIDIEIPFASAAILGCAVMTGFGSVVNVAKVKRDTSVVVLGAGGVGLSVLQGAVFAGARSIIAVDINPARLELAKRFGATDTICVDKDDTRLLGAAALVKSTTERGADYAFECTGVPELAFSPLAMVRNGGMAVAVSGVEQIVAVDLQLLEWDKLYINPLYGQCRPSIDFPKLLSLYVLRELKLDEMVTQRYPLTGLKAAFEDMMAGKNAKGVLIPSEMGLA